MREAMSRPWIQNSFFVVEPVQPSDGGWRDWKAPTPVKPDWADDEEKKKLFGVALASGYDSPFQAASSIFDDTSQALWASINWINDPIVVVARDFHLKTLDSDTTPLDKNQLAAKILKFCDEKKPNGGPAIDAYIRLKSLELYAKIQGYLKPDNSNSNNFTFNEMKVVVVKPQEKLKEQSDTDNKATVIDHEPIQPLALKLSVR